MVAWPKTVLQAVQSLKFENDTDDMMADLEQRFAAATRPIPAPAYPVAAPAADDPGGAQWRSLDEQTSAWEPVEARPVRSGQQQPPSGGATTASAPPALPSLDQMTAHWGGNEPQAAPSATIPGPDLSPESGTPIRSPGEMAPEIAAARQGTTAAAEPLESVGTGTQAEPDRFFAAARPLADAVEREYGIPAAFTLATAANETGYGQQRYQAGKWNYHGIQDTTGKGVPYVDWRPGPNGEEIKYEARQASFSSPLEGFRAFGRFLTENALYRPALDRYRQTGDAEQFARDVHAAGYAEDPQWSTKITSIMRGVPVSTGVGSVTAPAGTRPASGRPVAMPQGEAPSGGDLTPDQVALDDPDKWSLCGPVAAVAMARARGGNWTVAQAKQYAAEHGLWNADRGMAGLESEANLLRGMGYAARTGAVDWQQAAQDAATGNPVTLSTRFIPEGHYIVLEKYDPQTGKFYVGGLGNTLKKTTGRSKWMSPEELQALGPIEGALHFDNPSSPTPSVAAVPNAGATTPAIPSSPPAAAAQPTPASPAAGDSPLEAQRAADQAPGGGIAAQQMELRRQPLDPNPEADQPYTSTYNDPTDGGTQTQPVYTDPGASMSQVGGSTPPAGFGSSSVAEQVPLAPNSSVSQASVEEDSPYRTPPLPPTVQITQGGEPIGATPDQYVEMPVRERQQPVAVQSTERYLDLSIPSPPGWQAIVDGAGTVVDWVRERVSGDASASVAPPDASVLPPSSPYAPDVMGEAPADRFETPEPTVTQRAAGSVASAPGRFWEDVGAPVVRQLAPKHGFVEGIREASERGFDPMPPEQGADRRFFESARAAGEPIQQAASNAAGAVEQAMGAPPGTVRQAAEDVSNVLGPGAPIMGSVWRAMADTGTRSAAVKAAPQIAEAVAAAEPAAKRLLDPRLTAVSKQVAKLVKGDQAEADRLVGEFQRLMDSGAGPEQFAAFWRGVEENVKVKPGQVFALFRRFNMLSGPRTFEVNGLSGALNLAYEVVTQGVGQAARGRFSEAAVEVAAPFQAAGRAFGNLVETVRHGVTTEQAMRGDIPQALSERTANPAAKAVLTTMEIPDRLNAAVDQFFRTMTEEWAATILAHQKARASGIRPSDPKWAETVAANLDAIRTDPRKFPEVKRLAERVTFSEEPGGLVKWLEDGKRKYPNIIGFVAPFVRTPANIASRAVDMSPLGIARNAVEATTGVGRGTENLSARVRDNIIGTAGTIWAYNLAEQGQITGAGPDDSEKRAMLRATGWQPFSVRLQNPISGKTEYWSYANFAPFSLMLSTGAAASEAKRYAKPGETDTLSMLADGAARTGKVVTDMTVLAGLGAVVKSIQDPERYGGQWLSQSLQQLIPAGSFINTIGQATDPYIRRAERDTFANQVTGQVLSRIPPNPITPDRTDVPIAQDPAGRPIPNEQTGLGALNPFRPTTERSDPVLQPFIESGVDIGMPKETLTPRPGIPPLDLTPEDRRRWNELRGQQLEQSAPAIARAQGYHNAPKDVQQTLLRRILNAASEVADKQLMAEWGADELRRRINEAVAKKRAAQ